jgi:hypothetical protein
MFRKKLKYKNIIVKIAGVKVADSKKEYKRLLELKFLEKAGLVKNLQKQVTFELQEAFVDNEGKRVNPIKYVADFVYHCLETNRLICEDIKSNESKRTKIINGQIEQIKGFSTAFKADYIIKRKLFKKRYPQYFFFENYKKQEKKAKL